MTFEEWFSADDGPWRLDSFTEADLRAAFAAASPREVWVVIDEGRHLDAGAWPFSSEELAVAAAREIAGEGAEDVTPEGDESLVLVLSCSTEGDIVSVERRVMDAGPYA